jgi:hypothetical protein
MSRHLSLRNLAAAFLLAAAQASLGQADAPIKATTTVHSDGTRTVTVMDPEKRTTEETTETSNGKVLRRTTYLLDDRNQPLGAIAYDGKGNVAYRSSYRRDGMDRIDEETVSNATGQVIRRRIYHYGGNNKVARIDEYDQAGNLIIPQRSSSAARPDKKKRR